MISQTANLLKTFKAGTPKSTSITARNADPNVARILVGNKNDMDDRRRVQSSEGQQMGIVCD
jgi:hypothetical protein